MQTQIHYTLLAGNLFCGAQDMETVDETASARRYAELIEEAIVAAYPDAEVSVDLQLNTEGVGGGARVLCADVADEDEIAEHVDRIAGQVFEQSEWLVETVANA